ncbi:hypothetical protein LSAT2_003819 [Lamellibrachia satsuma]|nr:hypothetical protein LSAT2_003819 [Lamellibrachia satsuma]
MSDVADAAACLFRDSNPESPRKGDKQTVSRSTSKASDDESRRKKEYFKAELERLRVSLNDEKARIKAPPPQAYTPNTFNRLDPYFNVYTAEQIIDEWVNGQP